MFNVNRRSNTRKMSSAYRTQDIKEENIKVKPYYKTSNLYMLYWIWTHSTNTWIIWDLLKESWVGRQYGRNMGENQQTTHMQKKRRSILETKFEVFKSKKEAVQSENTKLYNKQIWRGVLHGTIKTMIIDNGLKYAIRDKIAPKEQIVLDIKKGIKQIQQEER